KQATQAVEDKKKWENNSDWHEFEAKVYRAYLGNMLPKDADRLGQLREKFDGNSLKSDDAAKEDVTKDIREKLDKGEGLGWNAAEKKPKETMGGLVTILRKRVAELEKNWDAEKANVKKATDDLAAAQDDLKKFRGEWEKKVKAAEAKVLAE